MIKPATDAGFFVPVRLPQSRLLPIHICALQDWLASHQECVEFCGSGQFDTPIVQPYKARNEI
jgi:hypothetical protein